MDFLQGYSDDEEQASSVVEGGAGDFVEKELAIEEDQVEYNPDMDEEEEDDDDNEYGPPPPPLADPNSRHIQQEKESDSEDEGFGPQPAVPALSAEERMDQYLQEKLIPISQEVNLSGHTKAVTCLSIEPAGNRVVTGSLDYGVKLFDFGGMDMRHKAFNSLEVEDGHPLQAISHSPSGDRFVVCTSSSQPKVYDREGKEIAHFVKGDMYLRDMAHTKGHTMEVSAVQWHPVEKNIILTSSLDGTLRLWDLLGEAVFGKLVSKHVLKLRHVHPNPGNSRLAATACCFNLAGNKIIGATADGVIQCWLVKTLPHQTYQKPDQIYLYPGGAHIAIQSLTVSPVNNLLAARYQNGTIVVWDISSNAVISQPVKTPLHVITGMTSPYPTANVTFSPDASLLCCCSSPLPNPISAKKVTTDKGPAVEASSEENIKSRLHFYDITSSKPKEELSIVVGSQNVHAIVVKWHAATNQLFCSLSNGQVKVYFDAKTSKKGALLSCNKAPRREKDPSDFLVMGEIINPHALPMYRQDNPQQTKQKRAAHLKDPIAAKIPEKPPAQGPGKRENTSFFFTNYVLNQQGKATDLRADDPREALLRMDEKSRKDPMYLGRAYANSQPQQILSSQTLEAEQEEARASKKQKVADK